jgi:hypothetical protein
VDQDADLDAVVPLVTPGEGRTLELIRERLDLRSDIPKLHAALERGPSDDAVAELAAIDELYDFISQNGMPLSLIESLVDECEGPDGRSVTARKQAHRHRVAAYLASGAASGEFQPLADPEIAARFLIESIGWLAQRRKLDPAASVIDDQQALRRCGSCC